MHSAEKYGQNIYLKKLLEGRWTVLGEHAWRRPLVTKITRRTQPMAELGVEFVDKMLVFFVVLRHIAVVVRQSKTILNKPAVQLNVHQSVYTRLRNLDSLSGDEWARAAKRRR